MRTRSVVGGQTGTSVTRSSALMRVGEDEDRAVRLGVHDAESERLHGTRPDHGASGRRRLRRPRSRRLPDGQDRPLDRVEQEIAQARALLVQMQCGGEELLVCGGVLTPRKRHRRWAASCSRTDSSAFGPSTLCTEPSSISSRRWSACDVHAFSAPSASVASSAESEASRACSSSWTRSVKSWWLSC